MSESTSETRPADVLGPDPVKTNILTLPAHIQVKILSYIGVYDQVFGAVKTCKSWEKLLLGSKMLQQGRYPGFKYSDDPKVFDAHGIFNLAAGYAFKAKVEDGAITRYFYDNAERDIDIDDIEIYHVYGHPTPLELDRETYMVMAVGEEDISDCPFLDERALLGQPISYDQQSKLEPQDLDEDENTGELTSESGYKSIGDEEGYNSGSDSDSETSGDEEDLPMPPPDGKVDEDSEEPLKRTAGRQLYILVNYPGMPAFWAFELLDSEIVGLTIKETMEKAKGIVEENLGAADLQQDFNNIKNPFHYELEVRFVTWGNFMNHGCYDLPPSLRTTQNQNGKHFRLCACQI
ncbi:hypothetical protein TWF106_008178 [Orbilia oligospora]|uniref:F-box domain-containing protein n=1 Tax=Orbilia oligospora TaxID=2813651 RepID=A0A6G1MK72_ORBOL|nr:hypothetical protein TWF788_010683 [Orbilia oligospora]KAF3216778.1 hypothetical protein TWF106_008178 [Orbilia oligospora]KAF3259663.1 hypothetical protein TWF192_010519 [Orbilia oligospora]